MTKSNRDEKVIAGFGDEWSRFDQSDPSLEWDLDAQFLQYFEPFPWDRLPDGAVGFDAGCGSGRWAKRVAPRVGTLHCCDPSAEALEVARRNLRGQDNAVFHEVGVDEMPFAPNSMDFGYSLGVLHHIPDTQTGLDACVRLLKPGAPFLVYLYYAFDNRPWWFRALHSLSEAGRRVVSRSPNWVRYLVSQALAFVVYLPLVTLARALEALGADVSNIPLSAYRSRSFYSMRTDALDRFGTTLERRFTKVEIRAMMEKAGLEDIRFRDGVPFWCACGRRAV